MRGKPLYINEKLFCLSKECQLATKRVKKSTKKKTYRVKPLKDYDLKVQMIKKDVTG